MQQTVCFLCGSGSDAALAVQEFEDRYLAVIDPAYQKAARRLVVCRNCGYVYHNPQLEGADIQVLYEHFRDASLTAETPDEYFDRITGYPPPRSENYQKMLWLKPHVDAHFAGRAGRLLDIGCGGGVFIHSFLQHCPGWQAYGIEPTRSFAEVARRRLGIPVEDCSYRQRIFNITFDLITINQVLEHILDPVAFLEGVRLDLAEGGLIYIESPDVGDFGVLPPDHDRFMAQHLQIYSANSLCEIANRAGLNVVVTDYELTMRNKRNVKVLCAAAVARQPWVKDSADALIAAWNGQAGTPAPGRR